MVAGNFILEATMSITNVIQQYRKIELHNVGGWEIRLLKGCYPAKIFADVIEEKVQSLQSIGVGAVNSSCQVYAVNGLIGTPGFSQGQQVDIDEIEGYNADGITFVLYNQTESHTIIDIEPFNEFLEELKITDEFNYTINKWLLEKI